jgi:quinoprotein glucose dehydrogenase
MVDRKRLSTTLLLAACVVAAAGCGASGPEPGETHDAAYRTWRVYQGDDGSNQYSVLDQINKDNVGALEVAWIYHTGDRRGYDRSQIQCNPIIVDSVLFGTSPQLKALALHAGTGQLIWSFDPFEAGADPQGVNRGVAYWEEGDGRRLLFTAGPYLYALDARTGQPVPTFGEDGRVDLRDGLGRDVSNLSVRANAPGRVYRDLVILGSSLSEGPRTAPGHIRAYNVRTGAIAWTFHTIPHPGEFGYETWPEDAWQYIGGANNWTGMSLDAERGVVYIPTGSPAFDFWGGNRHGENLFGNSILALDAATGERVWHYQLVRHDLWDRDPPAPPNLVTVEHDGRRIDAVAQITKSGHVWLLDRDTGEPLFPVEELEVPASDLKGEQAWPTQHFPAKPPPFARQTFTEADVSDLTPETQAYLRQRLEGVRMGGQFIPPSTDGIVIFPGFDGGGEWGGAAFDPATGLLYVNSNEMPWILTMVELPTSYGFSLYAMGKHTYAVHCAVCHGPDRQGDAQNTYPSLLNVDEKYTEVEVQQLLKTGRGFMPAFDFLTEREKEGITAFLFGQGEDEEFGSRVVEETNEHPAQASPYSHTGYNRFLDPDGYPAVKPPWGTLNAIDLNKGEIVWTVRLGEFPELTARGIPQTGTENYGGPVVTAGGLLFIGATKDEMFRVFDKDTGDVLWETKLPAGGYATPATYMLGGKQYVVIAAGGGKMGTKSGDAYVAFALPD